MRREIRNATSKVMLLFVAVIVLVAGAKTNAQPGSKTAKFSGTWETVAGSAYKYTVNLTQTGIKVTGTYSPRNGKIFAGVVTGNKLKFKWTQDGGYEGTGEFTMNDDGKGFAGSSTATKPNTMTNSWKTYVPGPPRSFEGTWETERDNRKTTLSIHQKGDKVTGNYSDAGGNGTIEGTVLERALRFTWESSAGRGSGSFQISTSGESFGGNFNDGDDPYVDGPKWWGTRVSEMAGGFGGKKLGSYAGTWIVNESGPKGAMELKQSGKVVTGVYRTAKGIYDLDEASVNGTILRFVLIPRNAANSIRAGEFVVDEKSFKGTIDGIAVTGTFKSP